MDTITSHVLKEGTSRHASTPDLIHNDSNSTLRTSIASIPSPPVNNGNHRLGLPINLDRGTNPNSLNRKESITSLEKPADRSHRHSMLAVTNLGKTPGSQDARGRLPSSASVGSMAQHGSKWESELEATLKVRCVTAKGIAFPNRLTTSFTGDLPVRESETDPSTDGPRIRFPNSRVSGAQSDAALQFGCQWLGPFELLQKG